MAASIIVTGKSEQSVKMAIQSAVSLVDRNGTIQVPLRFRQYTEKRIRRAGKEDWGIIIVEARKGSGDT